MLVSYDLYSIHYKDQGRYFETKEFPDPRGREFAKFEIFTKVRDFYKSSDFFLRGNWHKIKTKMTKRTLIKMRRIKVHEIRFKCLQDIRNQISDFLGSTWDYIFGYFFAA